jgi:hypothetical protein
MIPKFSQSVKGEKRDSNKILIKGGCLASCLYQDWCLAGDNDVQELSPGVWKGVNQGAGVLIRERQVASLSSTLVISTGSSGKVSLSWVINSNEWVQ